MSGQNLILNGSFEEYTELPASPDVVSYPRYWYNPSGKHDVMSGSPDYFHLEGRIRSQLPMSAYGHVYPQDSNAVCGLVTYMGYTPNFREYIATELPAALQAGKRYHFSMYVSNGERSQYMSGGIGELGIYFSNEKIKQKGFAPIKATPQVIFWEMLFTNGWQKVEGDFTATEAYRYAAVGNFFPDSLTDFREFVTDSKKGAYYFIDNLELTPIDEGRGIDREPTPTPMAAQPPIADALPAPLDKSPSDSVLAPAPPKIAFRLAPIEMGPTPPRRVEGRKVAEPQTVKVSSRTLSLQVYDSRAEDGDTISLNFNGTWIIQHEVVRHKPREFAIVLLEEGNNALVFYAHNLGTSPPNTAVVSFSDGGKRHILEVKSDLRRCGSIIFILKE